MKNKDEIKKILTDNFSGCVKPNVKYYTYGNIPEKTFKRAKKSYALDVNFEDVLVLVDTTLFGSAKNGLMITADAIYFKNKFEKSSFCKIEDAYYISNLDDTYYSLDGFKLMGLYLRKHCTDGASYEDILELEEMFENIRSLLVSYIVDLKKLYEEYSQYKSSEDTYDFVDKATAYAVSFGNDVEYGEKNLENIFDIDCYSMSDMAQVFDDVLDRVIMKKYIKTVMPLFVVFLDFSDSMKEYFETFSALDKKDIEKQKEIFLKTREEIDYVIRSMDKVFDIYDKIVEYYYL